MAKGGIRCWRDQTSELATIADRWLEDGTFPFLENVKILYTWVEPSRLDLNGMEIFGSTKKLPNNVRDIFGVDFIIEISISKWKELSEEERSRLLWHELNHCQVKLSPEGEVLQDSHGRVKIYLKKHDICFNTFSEELSEFGLSQDEISLVRGLTKLAKKQKNKELAELVTTEEDE